MFSVMLLTTLALPAADAAPSGLPPEQALAVIDAKGKLTITQVSAGCFGAGTQETNVPVTGEKNAIKVKISNLSVNMIELPAKNVEAYTVDGKAISQEKLATLLAKERTVLIMQDGKKADPFHLELYKEGTIVLVPPANIMGGGYGGFGPPGIGIQPVPAPFPNFPLPPPPLPRDDKKPDR